ncbi:MAG: hypothetical protein ABR968_07985 [Bacteroidales bacterium]|jgi:hypothetical protein
MKELILTDSYIHVNVLRKENSTEINFSTGEDYIGELFFLKTDKSYAGLIIGNEVWVIERKGKEVEVSNISVRNFETKNPYMVTDTHISYSNAISIVKKNLNVVFYKDCLQKNTWLWSDINTNEPVVEFVMKQGSLNRGKSIVNNQYLQIPETMILCALGWYFIQLQNEHSMGKLNYWEN